MSNRTVKFVSAIFAGLLASIALTTESNSAEPEESSNAAPAADDCLSGPKTQAPAGGHWYYRIDRVTKRHCWYLGEEREKHSRAAPQNSAPSENPVSLRNEAAARPSITDARAELPLPQTRIEREPGATTAWSNNNSRRANNAWDANTQLSVVASRWPEQSGSASPEPASNNSDAPAQPDSAAPPSPSVAAVLLAAADASSEKLPESKKQSGSIPMLLMIIVGALAAAGLTGSAIFRFGTKPHRGRPQIRGDRRSTWDLADSDRPSAMARLRADYPRADDPRAGLSMRSVDAPRELPAPAADDPNGRILEMLTRLHRSTAH